MKLLDLIFPPKCASCGEMAYDRRDDEAFCPVCAAKWEFEAKKCRRENGGLPVARFECGGLDPELAGAVLYAVNYNPGRSDRVQNELILKLKRTANVRVVKFCAKCIAGLIREGAPIVCEGGSLHGDAVITWIPRRREAVVNEGFDHMEKVAKELSKLLNIPALPLLKRSFISREQKFLDPAGRLKNALFAIRLSDKYDASGKTVILIDDIITTGASLYGAAKLLMESGARQIISAVLAESSRDD